MQVLNEPATATFPPQQSPEFLQHDLPKIKGRKNQALHRAWRSRSRDTHVARIWCNETANDFMNNRCRPACEAHGQGLAQKETSEIPASSCMSEAAQVNETMCASDEARTSATISYSDFFLSAHRQTSPRPHPVIMIMIIIIILVFFINIISAISSAGVAPTAASTQPHGKLISRSSASSSLSTSLPASAPSSAAALPSSTHRPRDDLVLIQARECMRTCGNYNTCTCRKPEPLS